MTHPDLTDRRARRALARDLRGLRESHPGWSSARVRGAAGPCQDCDQEFGRACAWCYAEAHADDRDDRA